MESGSSPRVRGTLFRGHTTFFQARFIPAGAGNTAAYAYLFSPRAVHPRGCGEHHTMFSERFYKSGSSPRVRGTLTHIDTLKRSVRFIPAGAGNTSKNHNE